MEDGNFLENSYDPYDEFIPPSSRKNNDYYDGMPIVPQRRRMRVSSRQPLPSRKTRSPVPPYDPYGARSKMVENGYYYMSPYALFQFIVKYITDLIKRYSTSIKSFITGGQ